MANPIHADVNPHNILLIKLRHHCDMLLTIPVINALRQRYPQANIDVLLYKETRPMLKAHPAIRQLHIIDRKWKQEGSWRKLQHERDLIAAVRASRYDIVINLADQWRSALVTLFSGAPLRIGFAFNKRDNAFWRLCHNCLVPTSNHNQLHTVEQNMTALTPLGISPEGARASMHFSAVDGQKVDTLLAALIARAQLFIGVDSAPMHMAAALDTPCIALFGPTKLQLWRPWGDHNSVIWAGDYGPLPDPDAIDTNTSQRYLSAIPVEDVVEAARNFLHD